MKARDHIIAALVVSGAFLALAAGLKYAANSNLISLEIATRATQVIIGLGLALYANFMPKSPGPLSASLQSAALSQAVLRVGGWSFLLGGLTYAAIWAFAPMALVKVLSITAVASAMTMTLGYTVWAVAACTMRPRDPSVS